MTPELETLLTALHDEKIIVLLAPSFPVDFVYPDIVLNLKMLGIEKVVELTYAAKLINMEYEKILKENPDKRYICPNCPAIVKIVEIKYPELKENIINVSSPMVVMNRFVKKEYGEDYKTLFIGPCFAKKMEAKQYGIDYAITFKELQDIFDYIKENNISPKEFTYSVTEDDIPDFDDVYNNYTKIYPLAGGVAESLHIKGIINKDEILVVDGPKNLDAGFQAFKNNKKIRFLDILACEGGCIGGPGIMSKDPLDVRKQKILAYQEHCKTHKDWSKLGQVKDSEGLDIGRK